MAHTRSSTRARRYRAATLIALGALLWPLAAIAQDQPPPAPPPPTPAAVATPPELPSITPERIAELRQSVQADTALDEAARAAALAALDESQRSLDAARESAARAAEWRKLTAEAPARLESIRAELAQPAPDPAAGIPDGVSLEDLEQRLSRARTELEAARQQLAEVDAEPARRERLIREIPEQQVQINQELAALEEQLRGGPAGPQPSDAGPVAQAQIAQRLARRDALRSRIDALDAEVQSYHARPETLSARRDRAKRAVAQLEALVGVLQQRADAERRRQAQLAAAEAEQRTAEVASRPELKVIAEQTAALANENTGDQSVTARRGRAEALLDAARRTLRDVTADFLATQRRVQEVGLTDAMGLLLRSRREQMPGVRELRAQLAARQAELSSSLVRLDELVSQREQWGDVSAKVAETLNSLDPPLGPATRRFYEPRVADLVTSRIKALDDLITEHQRLQRALTDLAAVQRSVLSVVTDYTSYINERALWIRSAGVIGQGDVRWLAASGRLMFSREDWSDASADVTARLKRLDPGAVLPLFGLLVVLVTVPRGRRLAMEIHRKVAKTGLPPMRDTLDAMGLALLNALPVPAALWALGQLLLGTGERAPVALGDGLVAAAGVVLPLTLLRRVCRRGGLGENHFNWQPTATKSVRRQIRWFLPLAVALILLIDAPESVSRDSLGEWPGRVAFVALMAAVGIFLGRLLRPKGPVMAPVLFAARGGWLDKLRGLWFVALIGVPIALAAMAAAGWVYTAYALEDRLSMAMALILGIALLNALFHRWLLLARRRIAIEQARKRREALQAQASEGGSVDAAAIGEGEISVAQIDTQTRQMVRFGMALTIVLGMWAVWIDVLPALGMLDRVELWPELRIVSSDEPGAAPATAPPPGAGPVDAAPAAPSPSTNQPASGGPAGASPAGPLNPTYSNAREQSAAEDGAVTLADVLAAVVTLLITIVAAKNVPGVLEIAVLRRLPMDAASKFAATTIVRYTITIIGITATLGALGIGWSKVQWLAAALTFGLAFGLQEIFANFVSGLIILIERPVRVGDIVTVAGRDGRVTRIRMRATIITDWDNLELIVPNKEFITSNVVNWTLTQPATRIVIPVGVAYGSDTDKARELLIRAAHECQWVMKDPPPNAVFRGFGDSSLTFSLYVHLANRNDWAFLNNDLHTRIDKLFREAGVEIAFPQRDIHIRSIDAALPVRQTPPDPEIP